MLQKFSGNTKPQTTKFSSNPLICKQLIKKNGKFLYKKIKLSKKIRHKTKKASKTIFTMNNLILFHEQCRTEMIHIVHI